MQFTNPPITKPPKYGPKIYQCALAPSALRWVALFAAFGLGACSIKPADDDPEWLTRAGDDEPSEIITRDQLGSVDLSKAGPDTAKQATDGKITDEESAAISADPQATAETNAEAADTEAEASPDASDDEARLIGKMKKSEPTLPTEPGPMATPNNTSKQKTQGEQASTAYLDALAKMEATPDLAFSELQALADLYPELSGPLVNMALIQRQNNNLSEAKASLIEALKRTPKNAHTLNLLGVVNRELGEFTAAKNAYLAAVTVDKNHIGAHYNLAVLADLYMRDYVLALRHLEAYAILQGETDRKTKGWLKDLKRRTKTDG